MKIALLFILLLNLPLTAFSTEHYYYKDERIDLNSRADKLAILLTNDYSDDYVRSKINGLLSSGDELKRVQPGLFLINFADIKTPSEIDELTSSLNQQKDLVKFVTKTYYGSSKSVTQIPSDVILVRLRNISDRSRLEILNVENSCSVLGNFGDDKGFIVRSNSNVSSNALELANTYNSTGLFEYAEPDFIYPDRCLLLSVPNDPYFISQWALQNSGQLLQTGSSFLFQGDAALVNGIPGSDMNVTAAWDITSGSPSIKIGIIDSGIDSLHPDLQSPEHLMCGYDAFNDINSSPVDYSGHGTSTAGLIGAVSNNNMGIAGIASGCKLMSIVIFDINGSTSASIISRAFDTATVKGIDVICCGWGGGTPMSAISDAIENAAFSGRGGLGSVILFSSGNDGRNPPAYPSNLESVLSVGSSTPHDQKKTPGTGNQFYWGSNYGEDKNGDLDLTAPTNCYTLFTDGGYESYFKGSSASAANAAGIAALVLSVNPALSRIQAFESILRGCDKVDNVAYSVEKPAGKWTSYHGYGRANAYNSVKLALGEDVTPPTINHKSVSSHSSTYPTIISAEISDQDGSLVPASGIDAPQLFYKVKRGTGSWSAFDSTEAYIVNGIQFDFKIPSLGWETEVQYYLKARDNSGNMTTFPKHAPANFWLCYFSVGNLTSETKKIPSFTGTDFGATISPPVYFSSFKILDTKFTIFMRHTYLNDEIIQIFSPLTDPNNNRKCLFSSNGGNMDNITGAEVSDSGTSFWLNGNPPYTDGQYMPEYTLKGFNGLMATGNWRILHFDRAIGDYAFFDSVKITLSRTTGTASSSVRHDSPEDSIVGFSEVIEPDVYEEDFYVRNSGTANLTVSNYSFSGSASSLYSITNTPPTVILPRDSGLFRVSLNAVSKRMSGISSDSLFEAVLNVQTNDPSKGTFRVSMQTFDSSALSLKNLQLTMMIEGLYDPLLEQTPEDAVTVYLRNSSLPFEVVDSAAGTLSTSGIGSFEFADVQNDVDYFISVRHRNAIETWSSAGQRFESSLMSYDFTDYITKAFGSNLVLKVSRYCLFSGDVNQDGIVDLSDLNLVHNASSVFQTGYTSEDITGDDIVDLLDITVAYNNTVGFVSAVTP